MHYLFLLPLVFGGRSAPLGQPLSGSETIPKHPSLPHRNEFSARGEGTFTRAAVDRNSGQPLGGRNV